MSKTLQTETADLVNLEMNSWEAARSAVFYLRMPRSYAASSCPADTESISADTQGTFLAATSIAAFTA